jgi:hypothetical protein
MAGTKEETSAAREFAQEAVEVGGARPGARAAAGLAWRRTARRREVRRSSAGCREVGSGRTELRERKPEADASPGELGEAPEKNRGATEIEGRRRAGQGRCAGELDGETQEREARIGQGGRCSARDRA